MASPHDVLDIAKRLTLKVERANKHFIDLEADWSAFVNRGYEVAAEVDPNTRDCTYRLVKAEPIPASIPLAIGDVVQNLRSALDHVAYHLVSMGIGVSSPALSRVYFPISENAAKHRTEAAGKIKGARQDAIDAINAIEPYGGGNGEILWQIHTLNNFDKHRMLVVALADMRAHSMTPSLFAKGVASGNLPGWVPPQHRHTVLMGAQTPIFPLNAGDVLLTLPDSESQQKMQFMIAPAFSEPQILRGQPVKPVLYGMIHHVRSLIFGFADQGLFV